MRRCERIGDCAFFNDGSVRSDVDHEEVRRRFCEGSFDECARLAVARHLGPWNVPVDLAPTDARRARGLLS